MLFQVFLGSLFVFDLIKCFENWSSVVRNLRYPEQSIWQGCCIMSSLRQPMQNPLPPPALFPYVLNIKILKSSTQKSTQFHGSNLIEFDHPSWKPNKTIEELPQDSQPSQGFNPPLCLELKSSPFSKGFLQDTEPTEWETSSRGAAPAKSSSKRAIRLKRSCIHRCLGFVEPQVGDGGNHETKTKTSMVFEKMLGIFLLIQRLVFHEGENQNLHFFSDVGIAFVQNGCFSRVSKPRCFKKTLETFHPNVKYFQGVQINNCRSPMFVHFRSFGHSKVGDPNVFWQRYMVFDDSRAVRGASTRGADPKKLGSSFGDPIYDIKLEIIFPK